MRNDVNPVEMAGPWNILLSHMALLGAAMIVDEAYGPGTTQLRWTDEPDARPQLRGVSAEELGEAIREHAHQHVADTSNWLHATFPNVGALFSARTTNPSGDAAWTELLLTRADYARHLRGLDSALVVGVGERAWWHRDHKTLRPDHGAAAWEMRTRNNGREFFTHSLLPIGQAVANRDPSEVAAGLTGRNLVDEPGKGKPDSRTATGLAPAGPADAARAWAGLWALSAIPVWAEPHGRSISSASLPPRRERQGALLMPMATSWTTAARMQAVLRSRQLIMTASADAPANQELNQTRISAAQTLLQDWGFPHVLRFPVTVTGSTLAPERSTAGAEVVGW